MMKIWIAAIVCVGLSPLYGQSVFQLKSEMNGILELDDGSITNFWGYGYQGPPSIELPAPTLNIPLGNSVLLDFVNPSAESHTIHLHGLDVDQANDGVPMTSFTVNQNESTTYSFDANYPGTFLYHCHVTTTIHLTMGMYGMIVVHHPDQLLFDGGPYYEQEKQYLVSDLEIESNDSPTSASPFNKIYPDYFMVNGESGNMIIEDTTQHVYAHVGESVALRIGSMAYTKSRWLFPEGMHAEVWMSDGRPLPNYFSSNELELYPGERFSVIIYLDGFNEAPIIVEYYSMLDGDLLGVNQIPIHNMGIIESVGDQEHEVLTLRSNWIQSELQIIGITKNTRFQIFDILGQVIEEGDLSINHEIIDVSRLSLGSYIIHTSDGQSMRFVKRSAHTP